MNELVYTIPLIFNICLYFVVMIWFRDWVKNTFDSHELVLWSMIWFFVAFCPIVNFAIYIVYFLGWGLHSLAERYLE